MLALLTQVAAEVPEGYLSCESSSQEEWSLNLRLGFPAQSQEEMPTYHLSVRTSGNYLAGRDGRPLETQAPS